MINTVDFSKRLKKVIEYYALSASGFADKLGVQRSSISHILSGRNKPSLDFVMKILNTFPEVELYWLLKGKGTFPKSEAPKIVATPAPSVSKTIEKKLDIQPELFSQSSTPISKDKEVEKVIIFYTDKTFDVYEK